MVIHILKDGSRVKDITGHIVKMSDAPTLYGLIEKIESRKKGVINVDKKAV